MSSDRLQTGLWVAFGLFLLWLLYLLSPILAPFLLAAIIAYICNPLVERIARWRVPRVVAVILVIVVLCLSVVGLLFILVPLLQDEVLLLIQRAPDAITLIDGNVAPWLREHFGIRLHLDPISLRNFVNGHLASMQDFGAHLFTSLRIGSMVVLGIVSTLLITPVVLFYLLTDWHKLIDRLEAGIPRNWYDKTVAIVRDVDAVLSQFLRGQLLVMLTLAVYYSVALSIVDIPSALPVGILTGLLIFIPYIGFGMGFVLALLVAVLQFSGWEPIIGVLVVYGIGQLLESFLLTPYLVGDRIGLHPLAVLFALMAFGQLFGFAGILIALPTSAALLVGLREVRKLYLASRFYRGNTPNIET
ncbi:MAG TPA: AI-2E family transporter [Rhodocyclaceae bacterium]|nr:AI-2E family transporter [Rhodocyclaceae bacterium]